METANRWIDERGSQSRDLIPGQYLSLCVSDTGTGMSPEVINRAFDPFFTTKPLGQGTGLGLSMVYGFVRQSGGQVRIYPEPDQGTNMCLYLPRHYLGAPEEIESADASESTSVQTERTVMIVDDEPTIRMLVAEVLEDQGYIPIEAGGRRRICAQGAGVRCAYRPAGDRRRVAGWHEWPAIGRCGAHHSTRPQSAVHYRL
ncbi:Hybrid two-component sensor histidine kinase/response regulator CvgSY, partial [Pseudomonas syringae pv. aptata]